MPIDEVKQLNNWYEVWSKSLAGPGYRVENYEELIHNFQWLEYWIKNYFFTKVSDNLLAFIFLIFVMVILFKSKPENKINFKFENVKIFIYFVFTISFLPVKHPTLRYGGYCILLILFSVPTSIFLSKNLRSISI